MLLSEILPSPGARTAEGQALTERGELIETPTRSLHTPFNRSGHDLPKHGGPPVRTVVAYRDRYGITGLVPLRAPAEA